LFNVLHYAVRPWPWIIVALASLIIYPDPASIASRLPHIDRAIVRNDLAYSAMLVYLPHGLLGLMIASLAAAYMSTISTHLNWGFLRGRGLLPAVRGAPQGRTPLRVGGARRHGGADRPRVGPVALAPELLPGVPDPAADRRRDRSDLPAALVLVAGQRLERDRRHDD